MKISFTGNHLFTYKTPTLRDITYNSYYKEGNCINEKQFACRVGDNKLLVLDGKELEDYNNAINCNIYIMKNDFQKALLQAYISNSIKVDLSNANNY